MLKKISASGTFFFNFDKYLILQKSVVRDERDGITPTYQVSHGFALKLLTAAGVSGCEQ